MNRKETNSRSRWIAAPVLLLLVLSLSLPSLAEPGKKKQDKDRAAIALQENLVWPLPPEKPRIRWLSQFTRFDEIEKKNKKKRSWLERLAGVKEDEEGYRGLTSPYGIAVDSEGRIYVADWSSGGVLIFDRKAATVEVLGPSRRIPLRQPLGVAIGERDRVFISDAKMSLITVVTREGRILAQFGQTELERPVGLAVDKKRHRLYVADAKAHRIAIFNSETFLLEKYVGKKSMDREPGTFRTPTNVAVDKRGNFYVTDTFNHRIQVFNRRGRFVRDFGTQGDGPGQFSRPKGIAVDSEGHIYVADAEFNNFQIFDQAGKVLLYVGTKGAGPGQFTLVTGLAIDAEDRIYTTEQYRPRVQIFQYISQPDSVEKKEGNRRKP